MKQICEKNLKNKESIKINEVVHQNTNQFMPNTKFHSLRKYLYITSLTVCTIHISFIFVPFHMATHSENITKIVFIMSFVRNSGVGLYNLMVTCNMICV